MNEADIPIDIHTLKLQDWLVSRRIVPKTIQVAIKQIRSKITNALQDMPSNEALIKLLSGTNINYFHCKDIIEILKRTEKDSKGIFGSYSSQRMKDWQEVVRLYERENVYLAETAQLYMRNINYEIPGVRKQMLKLEQQIEECNKKVQDLSKPESQLLAEREILLQQLGVKGNNLRAEFLEVICTLPDLYASSIRNIAALREGIELYRNYSEKEQCLSVLHHLVQFGNTTVYQYIHKEVPLKVVDPPYKLHLSLEDDDNKAADTNGGVEFDIDFGTDDNNGTSSTVSGELIELDELNMEVDGADIDWGIESTPTRNDVDINYDCADTSEFGIVVECGGMDGGIAKGDQAYTLLDSPNYRDRFFDEIYELEAFLRIRLYELHQLDSDNNAMTFSLLDAMGTHDAVSMRKQLQNVEEIIEAACSSRTRHLFQLKHSAKYANLLAGKLRQMMKSVEKIRANKDALRQRCTELKKIRQELNPVLEDVITQTSQLQANIEEDLSHRYKNRVVNLIGGLGV